MNLSDIHTALAQLEHQQQYRQRVTLQSAQNTYIQLNGRQYLSFASNDYLGLANHPALIHAIQEGTKRWGVGSGASHLVTGHFEIQQQAEHALAHYVQQPAALLFISGYQANLAVITSLIGRHDAVFADHSNHASLNDACLLSGAQFKRFRHNDLAHLEQLLTQTLARTRLIAVDAVYSMDGDEAALTDLLALARQYDAWLYVDDAHGFGLLGDGRGALVESGLRDERLLYMATLGKAAGVSGAFVAGHPDVIDWLVNKARSYIYSTSQSPALANAIIASLSLIAAAQPERAHLQKLIQAAQQHIQSMRLHSIPSRSPIQPIILGHNGTTLAAARYLQQQGIWVPAIRPPTVPKETARLRLSLCAKHQLGDIDRLFNHLLTGLPVTK